MANNKSFKVKNGLELEAYNKAISDTAVDVFVYDTRKDSDGGAWRKRTQHTSWYNETLNTATRGSRKEFPAVAVIVAETQQVTIYDGDDPDMPMWMVFNFVGYGMVSGSMNGVTAVNGLFSLGGGANGMSFVDFLKDRGTYLTSTLWNNVLGSIADRHVAKSGFGSQYSTQRLVNSTVNDVAMTVLPNAPIDAATGLPVPTIAVATDGGVSVIKDDGTVVSGGEANSSWYVWRIMFDAENRIWGRHINNFSPSAQLLSEAPYSSVNSIGVGTTGYQLVDQFSSSFGQNTAWPFALGNFTNSVPQGFASTKDSLCIGASKGFTRIYDETSDRSKSMVAYTTPTYNTGWMNGDIKLATLSDTDDTNVTATNLVVNGTFDSDTTWLKDGGWVISGGVASCSGSGTSFIYPPSGAVTEGQQVIIKLTISSYTSGNLSISSSTGNPTTSYMTATGTYTFSQTISGNASWYIRSDNFVGSVDNVELYAAEEDRSVNGNGLQVFGTVTKSAVSSGADLVAYSGFSASNYLEQPHNSDLDFGTGDFCIMGWVKTGSSFSSTKCFVANGDLSNSNGGWMLGHNTSQFKLWGAASISHSSNKIVSVATPATSTLYHLSVQRTGSQMSLFINGVLDTTVTETSSMTYTNAVLTVGVSDQKQYALDGGAYLALWRISATAPSPEQIKKIYEDEKVLFQENAQATLYGSSDAVTALAYDDSTELLHVGTSAGRSDFQGLRRINNTTTAVGSAISASNGLIADD